jgi:hypothetical protein
MHADGTEHRQTPAWAADLVRHLGQGGPLTAGALAERLQAHHAGLTAEQVDRELRALPEVHETAGGWVSLLALADGAVLSHLLSAEERKAGVLAADGNLDLWARLAGDEGLPLAGGGMLRTRRVLSPRELPRGSSSALAGPEGWLEEFGDDAILTLRLRDGALEVRALPEQQGDEAGEAVAERVKTVVQACAGAALGGLRAFATAVGVDRADDERSGEQDEPSDPGAALVDVLAELLATQPGVLDDPLPPLGLMLTAAGLEVTDGAVMLAGAPQDPDEVADLSTEEIRWFTLARGFLWAQEADRMSAEELGRFLSVLTLSPLVLERVADEVERNPANAALLEAARRAAATPVQRAAAALLTARAAEGDGRPVEAEELVLEALGHDPNLAPALRDAADYAATRGDAASADAHLRRAGAAPEDGLRAALRPLLVSPPRTTPRNSPCPCGSGRKYKQCCLRTPSYPLSTRAPARYASIATYATRAASVEVAQELAALVEPEAAMFALDLAIFDGGVLDDYLDERGDLLPGDELAMTERWRSVPLAPYEVTAVQPGASLTMRPLLGGGPVRLADRSLSAGVRRLDLLVARVLDDGDGPVLLAHPMRVDRRRRRALLELFDGGYEPWEVAAFFGPQPPPLLRNREGHLLVQCTATYDLPEAAVEAAWRRLAAELEEDDRPDRLLAIGQLDDGEEVIRGSVHRQQRQLTITANSVERLGELQQQVLAAAPGSRLVTESVVPMEELLAEGEQDPQATADPDAEAQRLGLSPEEEAALLEQVMRDYEQR